MRVVEVVWLDAWVETSTYSVKKAQKCEPVKTFTVGYLVSENEHGIAVGADGYEKDKKAYKTINFIPWGMVEEYYEFEDV